MEVAKEAGCLLSYDPNLRLPLWPSAEEARKQILSIWEKADLIKVSDNELEFLTGSDKIDDATALTLWHPNLKLLLVTLGEHGARYYTKVKSISLLFIYLSLFVLLVVKLSLKTVIQRISLFRNTNEVFFTASFARISMDK